MHPEFKKLINYYSNSSTVHVATAQCLSGNVHGSNVPGTGKALCNEHKIPYFPRVIYGTNCNEQGEVPQQSQMEFESLRDFIENLAPSPSPPPMPRPSPSPRPSPTPSPKPGCNFFQGRGMDSYDERLEASSRDDCCMLCAGRDGCTQAVYQNGKCKFGAASAAEVAVSDAMLCKLSSPSPSPLPPMPVPSPMPTPASCLFQQGMGMDNYVERIDVNSQDDCCVACLQRERCAQAVYQHGKCKFSEGSAAQVAATDAVLCQVAAAQAILL